MPFALLPLALFAVLFAREPRSIWPGIFLTFGLIGIASDLLSLLTAGVLIAFGDLAFSGFAAIILGSIALSPLALSVFLIYNMLVMLRREGRSAQALASGAVGALVLTYIVLLVMVATSWRELENTPLLHMTMGLFPSMVALGMAFLCYLTYTSFYQLWFSRFGGTPDAVVVPGSHVFEDGSIPPLLRGRVDLGIRLLRKAQATGHPTLLVCSGGQGADEPTSEGRAMADYAIAQGVSPKEIVVEDLSTTTEENLAYSAAFTAERLGFNPRVAVATSDYHAFRAAMFIRKAGLDGYALGTRTARYFWPSAKVREFFGILANNKVTVLVIFGLTLFAGIGVQLSM